MHIDPFVFGSNNITGTYTGDVKKGKLYVNDAYAGVIGGTFSDGEFTFYVRGIFKETDKVELEGLNSSNVVVVEKQLVEIIPASPPTKDLTLMIDSTEQTGTYVVEELTQSEYLALAEKDPTVVYAVKPNDPESGLVYFLGERFLEYVKDGAGTVLYIRNYIQGTSSSWKQFDKSVPFEGVRFKLADSIFKVGDNLLHRISLDNYANDSVGTIAVTINQYDADNALVGTVSGTPVAVGKSGNGTSTTKVLDTAASIEFTITANEGAVGTGQYRLWRAGRDITPATFIAPFATFIGYTVAPEDIVGGV